ncbi:hypothetical protein, partial [Achromobacter xylosoxidans]|uniref:hypothetical protein n=1 Tax=Alcaligenes xylosoxydans xylosoxydans TaxID=85698 RepID=UPI001EEC2640
TADLLHAMQALSQLSYTPVFLINSSHVLRFSERFHARFFRISLPVLFSAVGEETRLCTN